MTDQIIGGGGMSEPPTCGEPLEVHPDRKESFFVYCHEPKGHDGRHHAYVDDEVCLLTVGWPTDLEEAV